MKKSLLAITFVAFSLSAKTTRLRNYGCIAIVLLAGCSATQVRWDATKMRKDMMVYYNDQVMDNLIRAKYKLPFVHVDITLLTSQGGSQISGTIGAGETRTHTDSPPSMIGALSSITKAVMRPFAYSVTPQQTETLTISAAPALGSQTVTAPERTPMPAMTLTKRAVTTETYPSPSPDATAPTPTPSPTKVSTTDEQTLLPAPQPTPRTIYDLYEEFVKDGNLSEGPIRPREGTYVPGTLKKWGAQYYYIDIAYKHRKAYYDFCKQLFTKGQAGLLGAAFQQNLAAPLAVPTR
jgi:hypothetical protein